MSNVSDSSPLQTPTCTWRHQIHLMYLILMYWFSPLSTVGRIRLFLPPLRQYPLASPSRVTNSLGRNHVRGPLYIHAAFSEAAYPDWVD